MVEWYHVRNTGTGKAPAGASRESTLRSAFFIPVFLRAAALQGKQQEVSRAREDVPGGRVESSGKGEHIMARRLYKFIRSKDKNKFLNWVVELGTVSAAARKMGLSRQAHYFWMHEDDAYRMAYQRAREMANDLIEEEAYRRGVEGEEVEIYYKGAKVGTKRVYSDALLAILLKGAFPDKYKDRVQEEHVGDGSSEISWEGEECEEGDGDDGGDDAQNQAGQGADDGSGAGGEDKIESKPE